METNCQQCQQLFQTFLDGTLNTHDATRMRWHLRACDACKEEYEWFLVAGQDLEALGDALAGHAPKADLLAGVLQAVGKAAPAPSVSLFAPAPKAARRHTGRWVAAAACVLAAFGALFLTSHYPVNDNGLPIPIAKTNGPDDIALPPQDAHGPTDEPALLAKQFAQGFAAALRLRDHPPAMSPMEAVRAPELSSFTKETVAAVFKESGTLDAARPQLNEWVQATLADASQRIAKADTPPEMVIGLAAALPPAEAEQRLVEVMGHYAKNPAARVALAQAVIANPESTLSGENPLAPIRELDPDNALDLYYEALSLLNGGDLPAALTTLDTAKNMSAVRVYSLDLAAFTEQALVESGVDPGVARQLAAFTAGMDESEFLGQLGNGLLDHAKAYADAGDLDTAQKLFDAVRAFGKQVETGALFAQVQQTGLDLQLDAISGLEEVASALGSVPDIKSLIVDVAALIQQFENLLGFQGRVGSMLGQDTSVELLSNVAGLVLEFGELGLLDHL